MAMATLGTSLGGMLIVPLTAGLLQQWGGLTSGLILAAMTLGVILPLTLWGIPDGPASLGLHPDGDSTPSDAASPSVTKSDDTSASQETLAAATRTLTFWALAFCFPFVVMTQAGFAAHKIVMYQATFGLLGAAGIATMSTFIGVMSRIGFMWLNPRWAPQYIAMGIYLLEAVGLVLLAFSEMTWLLIASAAILGFCMSLTVTLEPLITAECFGHSAYGRIYGPIYFATRIAAALGVLLYGVLANATGNYQFALCVMVAALVLATGSIFLAALSISRRNRAMPARSD